MNAENTQDIYFFHIYFTDVGITGVRQSAYRYGTRPCLASSQLVGRNVDVKKCWKFFKTIKRKKNKNAKHVFWAYM